MRSLLVILLVLFIAAPAAADETPIAKSVTPLTELTAEAEAEIAVYRSVLQAGFGQLPLPETDLMDGIQTRMLHADAFIGLLLSRAHDTLHATLPDEVAHVVLDIGMSIERLDIPAVLDAGGASAASVRAAEDITKEWVAFETTVERLRKISEPWAPKRVCPVEGSTSFRNEWEYPRSPGRNHKGVDLLAATGTPLVAVEDGVVIQANWHFLGGRQVYFKGDSTGDVYYYAHLQSWPKWLWAGTRLEAGDYLGMVGSSGNAATPHLHLGWMPRSEVVDPSTLQNAYFWLLELCE